MLSDAQIQQFIEDGYTKIEHAFPAALAEEARAFLWKDLGGKPDDPTTWTLPVVRLGMYTQEPFVKAANTPVLRTDQASRRLAPQHRKDTCACG